MLSSGWYLHLLCPFWGREAMVLMTLKVGKEIKFKKRLAVCPVYLTWAGPHWSAGRCYCSYSSPAHLCPVQWRPEFWAAIASASPAWCPTLGCSPLSFTDFIIQIQALCFSQISMPGPALLPPLLVDDLLSNPCFMPTSTALDFLTQLAAHKSLREPQHFPHPLTLSNTLSGCQSWLLCPGHLVCPLSSPPWDFPPDCCSSTSLFLLASKAHLR